MKTMTVRQFLEMTGMSQATLRRRLIALDVSPIGVCNEGKTSWLWAVKDLKKRIQVNIQPLVGVLERYGDI